LSLETLKNTLKNFGITENEAEIYIFLAKGGTLKTGQIAKQLRKNKGTVYRTLSNLKKKGFVESTLESPTRYMAIPLEKIIDLYVKSRREEVAQVEKTKTELLEHWERLRKARIQPITETFVVIEGNKKIYTKILQMIEKIENQISIILPISKISRGEQFGIFEEFTKHPKKSKIKFRMLTELSKQNLKATKLLMPKIKSEIDFRATIPSSKQRTLPRMVIRDRNWKTPTTTLSGDRCRNCNQF
jgi:sugar-specific transcriptional regulator TrmB